MNDIFDIKNNLLWLPFSFFISIFFIICLSLVYFILNYLKNNKAKNKKVEIVKEEKEIIKIDFQKELSYLEENYLEIKTSLFYKKVSSLIRDFMEQEKNIKDISKMTLSEIKKLNLDSYLENLIKHIYFNEYLDKENPEEKKEIIIEMKKIIK